MNNAVYITRLIARLNIITYDTIHFTASSSNVQFQELMQKTTCAKNSDGKHRFLFYFYHCDSEI